VRFIADEAGESVQRAFERELELHDLSIRNRDYTKMNPYVIHDHPHAPYINR
jgi:hypothetical protein